MNRFEKAFALHEKGYNCAQAVIGAYADVIGIGEQEAYIEELESKIETMIVQQETTIKESVKSIEDIRREEVIIDVWKRVSLLQRKNAKLNKKLNDLSREYAYILSLNERLRKELGR